MYLYVDTNNYYPLYIDEYNINIRHINKRKKGKI